jgi:group I intron endonuclease
MIVYLITNKINGKRYVGQTSKTLTHRWNIHCRTHHCPVLRKAIDKYGFENFSIEPIVEVSTRELANEFEREYILRYLTRAPNGYNLSDGGDGSLGHKVSEKSKKIISEKLKGNQCALGSIRTPEMRAHLSDVSKNMSMGQRQLLREARLKQTDPRLGKYHSEESKKRMSDAHKNMSNETKLRMSLAAKARWASRKIEQ